MINISEFDKLFNDICPYYNLVPKDYLANLKWRKHILLECQNDKDFAKEIACMCARDILFYVNTFCWTYDPRHSNPLKKEVPFITYSYQDEAMVKTVNAIYKGHDIFTDKSRDTGASWVYLTVYEWMWHFHSMCSFLMVSRKEEYVDKTGDPKSLFWKVDYILSKLPLWLVPKYSRTKLHLLNEDNGSTIEGESTTGSVARGDRKTSILLDEFADVEDGIAVLSSTGSATRCRIFNSTYKGAGNAFYEVSRWSNIEKIRFHWSQHPVYNIGLYKVKDKQVEIIDKKYHEKYPGYKFVLEHGYYQGLHSPWYDNECLRRTPQDIKEQLDIDPHGSGATFFDYEAIDKVIDTVCLAPLCSGYMKFSNEDPRDNDFVPDKIGPIKLWIPIGLNNKPLKPYNFKMGIDISAGTGASNSVICAYDSITYEKLLEFISSTIKPSQLAKYAVALASWLNDLDEGKIIWETPGPGREFGSMIQELNYQNIYYKRNEDSEDRKETDVPGFFPTQDTKKALLGVYRRKLESMEIKNYSQRAVMECREMVYDKTGNVKHSRQIRLDDPGGARDNHGDIVIADALTIKLIEDQLIDNNYEEVVSEAPEIPENSPEGRRLEYLRSLKKDKGWND